jgi:hypothetical protein
MRRWRNNSPPMTHLSLETLNPKVAADRVGRQTLTGHFFGYVRGILSLLGELEMSIQREEVLKRVSNAKRNAA